MNARDEAFAEGARLLEDAACDADWTRTPDFCTGLRAGAELLLAKTGEEATTTATATPGFFVAGRIYRAQNHGDLHFHCLAVSPHPETGEPKAFGWRYAANHKQWRGVANLGADDWTCCDWTDTTEAGDQS